MIPVIILKDKLLDRDYAQRHQYKYYSPYQHRKYKSAFVGIQQKQQSRSQPKDLDKSRSQDKKSCPKNLLLFKTHKCQYHESNHQWVGLHVLHRGNKLNEHDKKDNGSLLW